MDRKNRDHKPRNHPWFTWMHTFTVFRESRNSLKGFDIYLILSSTFFWTRGALTFQHHSPGELYHTASRVRNGITVLRTRACGHTYCLLTLQPHSCGCQVFLLLQYCQPNTIFPQAGYVTPAPPTLIYSS
jgi:hypothetical protein